MEDRKTTSTAQARADMRYGLDEKGGDGRVQGEEVCARANAIGLSGLALVKREAHHSLSLQS
jgi:hypothetical protein